MPRQITIDEVLALTLASVRIERLTDIDLPYQQRALELVEYEDAIDQLIALARPEMLAAWNAAQEQAPPNPPSPSAPPSPGADGAAASPIPAGGSTLSGGAA